MRFIKYRVSENMFLLFLVQIRGGDCLYQIEETKLVSAISRKLIFGLKNKFGGIGGPKMALNDSEMILK